MREVFGPPQEAHPQSTSTTLLRLWLPVVLGSDNGRHGQEIRGWKEKDQRSLWGLWRATESLHRRLSASFGEPPPPFATFS